MAKKHINLLPPEEQQTNKIADADAEVRNFGFWVVMSFVFLAAFFAVYEIILQTELRRDIDELSIKNSELSELKKTPLRQQLEALNLDLENFQALSASQAKWSNVLAELARRTPPAVTLDKLSLDRASSKIEIEGHAGTRDAVLALRQNILSSPYFRNINFPLDNLEKETDLKWKYRFYVNPEFLK